MRGRTKDEVTAMLRARRIADASATEDTPAEGPEEGRDKDRHGDAPEAFWSLPAEARELPLRFEPAEADALAVKRLGPPPFWRDTEGFVAAMEQAYAAIAEHAYWTAEA